MGKTKVLFLSAAADSDAADDRTHRLSLDEDIRSIREKVRRAESRDSLIFDVRLAARTDDLLAALSQTHPQVVHFSGHSIDGLIAMDERASRTGGSKALGRLFSVFRGDIRLIVLNACFSRPLATDLAEAVGCVIGTQPQISDAAALTFGASLYRALAFGLSVQEAYDQAHASLALNHLEAQDLSHISVGPGVDPRRLVLSSSVQQSTEDSRLGAIYQQVKTKFRRPFSRKRHDVDEHPKPNPSKVETTRETWTEALLRGAAIKDGLLNAAGRMMSLNETAVLLKVSVDEVQRLHSRSKLLALPLANGEWGYPARQFAESGRVHSGLPRVLSAFRDASPWVVLSFLMNPVPGEDKGIAFDALSDPGAVDRLVEVARTYGEQGAA